MKKKNVIIDRKRLKYFSLELIEDYISQLEVTCKRMLKRLLGIIILLGFVFVSSIFMIVPIFISIPTVEIIGFVLLILSTLCLFLFATFGTARVSTFALEVVEVKKIAEEKKEQMRLTSDEETSDDYRI